MTRHVINFQPRFAALVESGAKRQTIRRPRTPPIAVGDTLNLGTWIGTPRRKGSKRRQIGLGRVIGTMPVVLTSSRLLGFGPGMPLATDASAIAEADGFKTAAEMYDFFDQTYGLPFEGVLIQWESIA